MAASTRTMVLAAVVLLVLLVAQAEAAATGWKTGTHGGGGGGKKGGDKAGGHKGHVGTSSSAGHGVRCMAVCQQQCHQTKAFCEGHCAGQQAYNGPCPGRTTPTAVGGDYLKSATAMTNVYGTGGPKHLRQLAEDADEESVSYPYSTGFDAGRSLAGEVELHEAAEFYAGLKHGFKAGLAEPEQEEEYDYEY